MFPEQPIPNILIPIVTAIVLILLKLYFNGGVYVVPNISLKGKYAVVTGGNSGIGEQTVKSLAKLGCSIVIGARNKATAEKVIKNIKKVYPQAEIQFIQLELNSKQSIQSFTKAIKFPTIDYLVNNAGVMAIPKRKMTKDGFEMQYGVNHLGHFYLTSLLWNKIQKSQFFRVVNVSSLAHKRLLGFLKAPTVDFENIELVKNYDPNLAYSRSKLYNVLFTRALSKKIDSKKGVVVSLHPGVVRTELMRQIISEGFVGKIIKCLLTLIWPLYCLVSKNAEQGNYTTMYCLLSNKIENGCYYADCKKDTQNPYVTEQNWTKLWQISENKLGIKFAV